MLRILNKSSEAELFWLVLFPENVEVFNLAPKKFLSRFSLLPEGLLKIARATLSGMELSDFLNCHSSSLSYF